MDTLKNRLRAVALALLLLTGISVFVVPDSGYSQAIVPAGKISVAPSGDTTGVTDAARLKAAFTAIINSRRLPPLASSYYTTAAITLQPGTYYYTASLGNILGTLPAQKVIGFWLQCSGRGVTNLDYNPSSSGPFLTNNRGLDVKFSDCTFTGHDATSDFLWSQEQAGITNVQDYTFSDDEWNGAWNNIMRLTGGNNNSEWKFDRDTVSISGTGALNNWMYTPPAIATTITNGSSSIAVTNNAEQIEVGDTGTFSAAVSPLAANTQYYVVSATTTTFQVATTAGGTPVSFTANGTPTFVTASDQFLNFWFAKCKFDTSTSIGQWLTLNYGGSVKIRDSDISGHQPSSVTYVFNLLGNVHAQGVQTFEADGLRVEHNNNNSRLVHSQWSAGAVIWNNLDESAQAGNRTITNAYAFYEIVNNRGPIIEYHNSQLMGVHNYVNNTGNYAYQNKILYENVTLYDNPSAANFITVTNLGNSGGYPQIRFVNSRNNLSSTVAGYHEVVDTDLFWNSASTASTKTKTVACVSANSDWPFNGGNFQIRLPLNAMVTQIRWWLPVASSGSGAYNYSIQTTEGTPTVLGTVSGSNSATPVPASSLYSVTPNFVMTSDAARTIEILDTITRTTPFTNFYCLIDYIGDLAVPIRAINDDDYDQRAVA